MNTIEKLHSEVPAENYFNLLKAAYGEDLAELIFNVHGLDKPPGDGGDQKEQEAA